MRPSAPGAYKVKSFTAGDNVQYVINDNYREATAPFFDAIDLKGGGDAGTAAQGRPDAGRWTLPGTCK